MKRVVAAPLLAAGILLLGSAGCGSEMSDLGNTAPQEIRGVWSADDPEYAGLDMEIHEDALVFHAGDGDQDFTVHPIQSVRAGPTESGSGTAYEIEYLVDGEAVFTFSFTHESEDDGIVFKNEPHRRWYRAGEGG